MAKIYAKIKLKCALQDVWRIVTSFENYSWRSDLQSVEILDERRFVEYSKGGHRTTFVVNDMKFCKRLELEMENENIKGFFVGLFSYEDGFSVIEFSENIRAKKWFLKPILPIYLKIMQRIYIWDLKRALNLIFHKLE